MSVERAPPDTGRQSEPAQGDHPMPENLIIIFLLFIAVLAFGWFYWQRAKARTTTTVEHHPADAPSEPPADHAS